MVTREAFGPCPCVRMDGGAVERGSFAEERDLEEETATIYLLHLARGVGLCNHAVHQNVIMDTENLRDREAWDEELGSTMG
jgi:hypothetical protein